MSKDTLVKRFVMVFIALFFICDFLFSRGIPCPDSPTVTDIDGNVYNTVQIGTQLWMKENLKVTHYRNGDAIPYTPPELWRTITYGACYLYNNNPSYENPYGELYNCYAVRDTRGLSPTGWHVPSDAEWKKLEIYLGMSEAEADSFGYNRGVDENVGSKLKESDTIHWDSPNLGATNESGFTAVAGGMLHSQFQICAYMGYYGNYWASGGSGNENGWYRQLCYSSSGVTRSNTYPPNGFSVRCICDTLMPGDPDITVTPDTVQFLQGMSGGIDTLHQVWEDVIPQGWPSEYRVQYEASKLTPAFLPCSITAIAHGVVSPDAGVSKECSVFVWNDVSGAPGTTLAKAVMNISVVNADSLYFNWYNINPPVYVTGPFWVGNYEMDTLLPTTVIDYVPTTDATKYSLDGSSWNDEAVDYLHIAVVNYGGASCDTVKTMVIKNDGSATLNVSSITKDQLWIVSVAPTSFSIPVHSSQDVTVTVSPAGLGSGTYYGTLTISSDDADENPYEEPVKLVVGQVGTEENSQPEADPPQAEKLEISQTPFCQSTVISYEIQEKSEVSLKVYDMTGREVKSLVDKTQSAGHYTVGLNGKEYPAGIYFVRFTSGDYKEVKKLTLVR